MNARYPTSHRRCLDPATSEANRSSQRRRAKRIAYTPTALPLDTPVTDLTPEMDLNENSPRICEDWFGSDKWVLHINIEFTPELDPDLFNSVDVICDPERIIPLRDFKMRPNANGRLIMEAYGKFL